MTGISAVSHLGATVTLNASQVNYQPSSGLLGSDWFTYTLMDPSGLSAEGRVDVLVYTGTLPAANQLSLIVEKPGFRVRYRGTPAHSCELQRSVNLMQWTTLLQTAVPAHGIVEYVESNPPASGAYYRVRQN
jgi:hypothetical protein